MTHAIARYLNVRQAYYPDFAGNSRRVVFITDITGVPQVWQVEAAPGGDGPGWPDQLTFEANRVQGVWCSPAQSDERLIYARDTGGNENAQLFMLAPSTAGERNLTAGHEHAMHTFGAWSDDGSTILFAANRRDRGLFDVYIQPLDGEPRLIWQNDTPGFLGSLKFSPDGRRAVVVRAESGSRHELWEIDLAGGNARRLAGGDEDARYEGVHYAPDGRSLYVNTDRGLDLLYIARLDLETLALETVVAVNWDIQHLELSPDGRSLAYVINEDGQSRLCLFDVETGAIRNPPPFDASPGVVGWLDGRLRFALDSGSLLFAYSAATRTGDIYLWDLLSEHVTALTRSGHGGLPREQFSPPELIHYPTFDDRQIPAWFYRPRQPRGERTPAIVIVHGGPEGQTQPFFTFLVQYYIASGFAVLAPNVRGSTGYGKAYGHLDDVRLRMDSVADVAYGAHWLKARPDIDGNRIAVTGGSYGGFVVLASLTTYPDLWAAGVDIVGISNFVTFLENTSAYRRAHREAEYGSLAHDREFLESIAPINHLDQIRAPLLVIHGANDPRVPLSEAQQLEAALRERGVPVELLVFDDEGHGIVKLKNKLVAYPRIVAFLDEHLGR